MEIGMIGTITVLITKTITHFQLLETHGIDLFRGGNIVTLQKIDHY